VRVTSVVIAVGLMAATAAGCSGGDDKADSTQSCVGTDTPGSTHVLSSRPVNLPSGGRAVLTEAHLDAKPPTAASRCWEPPRASAPRRMSVSAGQ